MKRRAPLGLAKVVLDMIERGRAHLKSQGYEPGEVLISIGAPVRPKDEAMKRPLPHGMTAQQFRQLQKLVDEHEPDKCSAPDCRLCRLRRNTDAYEEALRWMQSAPADDPEWAEIQRKLIGRSGVTRDGTPFEFTAEGVIFKRGGKPN